MREDCSTNDPTSRVSAIGRRIQRRAAGARLTLGWGHDVGYRLQELAERVSGGRTPGPAPPYLGALFELTQPAGVSAADLLERALRGGHCPAQEGAR